MELDLIDKTVVLDSQSDHHPLSDGSAMYQLRQFPDGKLIGIETYWSDKKKVKDWQFDVDSQNDFQEIVSTLREQRGGDGWVNNYDTDYELGLWKQSVVDHMREMEAKWEQRGDCFAWIDPEPTFCPASDWSTLFSKDGNYDIAFPDPEEPCNRIIRFSLIGGGQIRSTEHFKPTPSEWGWGRRMPTYLSKIDLKVTAHTAGGITIAAGYKYEGPHYEMNAQAVVLRWKQDIADRAAAIFRLINNEPENFFALMDGSEGCAICGRALRDEISKLIGVGPECAHKYGIPHSREAAERRLTLRLQLLQEGKTE